MKSWSRGWNKGSHDLTLKNGEVIKEYFIEYRTRNKKEILLLQKICTDLVDRKFDEILGEEE